MKIQPDLFTNVHKGIRRALFTSASALGRAGEDRAQAAAARALLAQTLHFIAHHGDNEDVLLLPVLEQRAPTVFARMVEAHRRVNDALAELRALLERAGPAELYQRTCAFTSVYLEHMREEECELESAIRAALSDADLSDFARGSVQRTAPADQRMMLGFILPALPRAEAELFLSRLPPALAEELRPLVDAGDARSGPC